MRGRPSGTRSQSLLTGTVLYDHYSKCNKPSRFNSMKTQWRTGHYTEGINTQVRETDEGLRIGLLCLCSSYSTWMTHTFALTIAQSQVSHASKVLLKVNREEVKGAVKHNLAEKQAKF